MSVYVFVLLSELIVDFWEIYIMKVLLEKDVVFKKIVLKVEKGVLFEFYELVLGWIMIVDKKNGIVIW